MVYEIFKSIYVADCGWTPKGYAGGYWLEFLSDAMHEYAVLTHVDATIARDFLIGFMLDDATPRIRREDMGRWSARKHPLPKLPFTARTLWAEELFEDRKASA